MNKDFKSNKKKSDSSINCTAAEPLKYPIIEFIQDILPVLMDQMYYCWFLQWFSTIKMITTDYKFYEVERLFTS